MKRLPEIAPFVDQFGRPAYSNPLGQNRPNPALNAPAEPAPVEALLINELDIVVEPAVRKPISTPAASDVHQERRLQLRNELRELLAAYEMKAVNGADTASSKPSNPPHLHVGADGRQAIELDDAPTAVVAGRLATEIAERRTRIHRNLRRGAAVVIAAGAGFAGIAAAYAYFTAHGAGAGSATVGTLQPVTVAAGAGTPSTPLLPGGSADVTLKVNNPNAYPVTLVSVTANGGISASGGTGTCTTTGVTFNNQTMNTTIPANSAAFAVDLTGAASMSTLSQSGCQGATFSIPVSITVNK